ncbi:hypothetical protein V1498_20770 [Peribacillus sp. SCS-26]|uniref:hypothetical protein n=1 Tax=Paraperibacillus marinus TaxID=3115295 RepID=UPI0039064DD5
MSQVNKAIQETNRLFRAVLEDEAEQRELFTFVTDHSQELNQPRIIVKLLTIIDISSSFITQHLEFCLTFFHLIQNTSFRNEQLPLAAEKRMALFCDLMNDLKLN